MKHTAYLIKKPKLLYLGFAFLFYGTFTIFNEGDYFGYKALFFIVGIAWLLASNMILKKARIELTGENLKFFNQIGYQYRVIPIPKIRQVKMNEEDLFIRLEGGKSLDLIESNFTKDKLSELERQLNLVLEEEK